MLEIPDLEKVEKTLETNGANFVRVLGSKSPKPCQNILVVYESKNHVFEEDIEQVSFENWKLHHVNIQAVDVRKSVKFLSTNLGLKKALEGARG